MLSKSVGVAADGIVAEGDDLPARVRELGVTVTVVAAAPVAS